MFSTSVVSISHKPNSYFRVVVVCPVLFPFWSIESGVAQTKWTACGPSQTTRQVLGHAGQLLHGIAHVPRAAIRPENLKWELPIGLATGLLIAEADQPAANRIQSKSLQDMAGRWSDAGLVTEIAAGGATWGVGCIEHKSSLRNNGLTALTAMGAAGTLDLALVFAGWAAAFGGAGMLDTLLKQIIRRPRPVYAADILHDYSFSFPSGHAMGSLVGYGMLAYVVLILWITDKKMRVFVVLTASVLVLAIGISRLYLGVHYFSDVVGGYAAGALWLATCVTGIEIAQRCSCSPEVHK